METEGARKSESFSIDLRLYPLAVVHKAVHAFSCLADCDLRQVGEYELTVTLTQFNGDSVQGAVSFRRLLVDLAVQAQINEETSVIRQALVLAAMNETLRRGER